MLAGLATNHQQVGNQAAPQRYTEELQRLDPK